MILKIVKYPEPVLSQPGEPVTEFNDELRKFVADMFETMYAAQGIGLAAPQVAVSKRVTVIDLSMGKDPEQKLVLVNPEVIQREGKQCEEEGCLSFPEIREKVPRAWKVRVRAQNEQGEWFEMDGEELLSRCFQHEIDHLDGMLFIFDDPGYYAMWMKNTLIPLSVAFVDRAGMILNIEDMEPQTLDTHLAAGPALYAIETNKGWFAAHHVKAGDTVTGLPKK